MRDLYNRLIGLIGKNGLDADVRNFLEEVGESPVQSSSVTFFSQSGFCLMHKFGDISGVLIHLKTPAVESGAISQFKGRLPFDLQISDDREVVAEKLAHAFMQSNLVREDIGSKNDHFRRTGYIEISDRLVLKANFHQTGELLESIIISPLPR